MPREVRGGEAGVRFPNHLLPEVRSLLQAAQEVAQNAKVPPGASRTPAVKLLPCMICTIAWLLSLLWAPCQNETPK